MKKQFLMIVVALLIGLSTYSQTSYKYEEVIEVPNTNKAYLFSQIKSALASIYNDVDSVIEYDDKEAGIIMGNGIFHVPQAGSKYVYVGSAGDVKHKIKINIKDNKYKISIYDLVHTSDASMGDNFGTFTNNVTYGKRFNSWSISKSQMVYSSYRNIMNNKIQAIVDSIKSKVSSSITEEDDW